MTDDLITKLEAATEGSRELDVEVIKTLPYLCDPTAEYDEKNDCLTWYEVHSELDGCPSEFCARSLPHYTTSLDDALTLVPKGWKFYVDSGSLSNDGCHACVYKPHGVSSGALDIATPALALCIAALKARERNLSLDIRND